MSKLFKIFVLVFMGFLAGRMSASEAVQSSQSSLITPGQVLALVQNVNLQAQYPSLYNTLIALLSNPALINALSDPENPQNSALLARLSEFARKLEALA